MALCLPKKGALIRFRSNEGVSLIELMVAAGLLLGLALAIVYLFGSSTKGLQRARQTSARDTNYMNVGRLAADPMSLLNSYNAAVANTGYNPCLHSDANGGSTPSVAGCAPYLLASSTAALTPSSSNTFTPNTQYSRDPGTNQALWFPMTLYDNQTTNSLAVAGPYPDIPSTAFTSRPNIRYTRDGKRCEYQSDEAALKRICPVEALSFYSGVCRDNASNCQKFSRYLVHVRFNFDDGSNQPPPQDDIHLLRLLNTVSEVSCSTLGLAACPALSGTDTSVQWNFSSTNTTTSTGTGTGTGGALIGTNTGTGTGTGTVTGTGTGTGTSTGTGTGTGTSTGGALGPATVSKIEPANGPTTGGTVVGITGKNFVDGMTLTIGGVSCTNLAVRSCTTSTSRTGVVTVNCTATCITPSSLPVGANNVVATNSLGSGTLAGGFTAYTPIASTSGRQVSLKMANLSYSGFRAGIGTAARVSKPQSPVTDASGNIYYREYKSAVIKKISPAGVVTVVAGIQGTGGYANGGVGVSKIYGEREGGDGCMAHDQASTLYFLDKGPGGFKALRKLDTTTNTVSTITADLAGMGYGGWWWGARACTMVYSGGALFFKGEAPQCGIFRMDVTTGATTLVAGNTTNTCGYVDGDGTAAQFAGHVDSMTALGSFIYMIDRSGNIRKMMNTAPYTVTSLFNANASPSCTAGDINTAKVGTSGGSLTNDGSDLFLIQDGDCQRIGKISLSSVNLTLYPDLYVGQNECGSANQPTCDGTTNTSGQPQTSIAYSGGAIYAFTETFDPHRLRKYDVASTPNQMQTFIGKASHAWPGVVDSPGGGGGRFHGAPAKALAWDGTYLYGSFRNFGNRGQMILRFNPATNAFSQFSTFGWSGDDPSDMAFDGFKLYYASRCAIYTIDRITGASALVAGAQDACNTATDGIGTAARFYNPSNVTTDGQYLYIADGLNCCNGTIRKMNLKTLEVTSTAVNEGQYYFRMHYHQGKVYFAPMTGTLLKAFDVATGTVTSIAGNTSAKTGDHANGTNASFGFISQITTLGSDLLIADEYNGTLRKVSMSGANAVSTFAGDDRYFEDLDGLFPSSSSSAAFFEPEGVFQTSHGIWILNRTGLRLIY